MRRVTRIIGIIACLTVIIPTVACGQSAQTGKSTGNAARSEAEIEEMTKKCAPQSWIDKANHAPALATDVVKYLSSDCTPKWMVNLDKDQLYSQVKGEEYYCIENCEHAPSDVYVEQIKNHWSADIHDLSYYQSLSYIREFRGDNDSLTITSPAYGPIDVDGTVYSVDPVHGEHIDDKTFVLDLNAKQIVVYETVYGITVFKAS